MSQEYTARSKQKGEHHRGEEGRRRKQRGGLQEAREKTKTAGVLLSQSLCQEQPTGRFQPCGRNAAADASAWFKPQTRRETPSPQASPRTGPGDRRVPLPRFGSAPPRGPGRSAAVPGGGGGGGPGPHGRARGHAGPLPRAAAAPGGPRLLTEARAAPPGPRAALGRGRQRSRRRAPREPAPAQEPAPDSPRTSRLRAPEAAHPSPRDPPAPLLHPQSQLPAPHCSRKGVAAAGGGREIESERPSPIPVPQSPQDRFPWVRRYPQSSGC